MSKIVVKERNTKNIVEIDNKRDFVSKVYSPISPLWSLFSPMIGKLMEKYKNTPITKHKMTEVEKRKLEKNPDYINDIPKYEVKGYDRAVSNSRMDRYLSDEFYSLFCNADETVIKFVNKFHPDYYVVKED